MEGNLKARVAYARQMARKVLDRYDLTGPPVDIEAILKAEGYVIERRLWPNSVSGVSLKEQRLIGVNGNHSRVRQRFTLGHEYGHLILRHQTDDIPVSLSSIDQEPQEIRYSNVEEREADIFSGELLVPLNFIKRSWAKCKDIEALAREYEVSRDVMVIQLKDHHLLFK